MPPEIVLIAMASIASVTMLGLGLMRTVSRHLERKHGGSGDLTGVRAQIEDMLAAQSDGIDDIRARLAELEERVDFTERLLTKRSDREQLPGPARDS